MMAPERAHFTGLEYLNEDMGTCLLIFENCLLAKTLLNALTIIIDNCCTLQECSCIRGVTKK